MADKISITICGDGGCGKSSITLRLVRSEWTHEYDPTIEDSYSVTRTVDGIPYSLSITDTAGQEEYRGLWAATNLKSDAFLLVYDITNPSSLNALDYFMDMIDMESDQRVEDNHRLRSELGRSAEGVDVGLPPPVKIIAGNKCDLKEARAVPAREGLEYARKHGCGFMETSAREMVNIEETFALLVRRVVEARQLHYGQGQSGAEQQAGGASSSSAAREADVACQDSHGAFSSRQKERQSRFLGLGKGLLRRASKLTASREALSGSGTAEAATREKPAGSTQSAPKTGLWSRLRCW